MIKSMTVIPHIGGKGGNLVVEFENGIKLSVGLSDRHYATVVGQCHTGDPEMGSVELYVTRSGGESFTAAYLDDFVSSDGTTLSIEPKSDVCGWCPVRILPEVINYLGGKV